MRNIVAVWRTAIAVIFTAFVELASVSSIAAAGQVCAGSDSGDAALCNGTTQSYAVVSVTEASGGGYQTSNSSASPIRYVPYDRLTTGPDGKPCLTTAYYAEGAGPVGAVPDSQDHIEGAGGYNNVFAEYPPCPPQPTTAGQAPPAETRAMLAARAWATRVPLPKPDPKIAPGRGITGKLAYLETKGRIAHSYTEETVYGPLQIHASGSYTVSWGDGETTGPHAFEGESWPVGRITHNYTNVGIYDIVVTERWTATWSVGGQSGVLRALQTIGRLDGFPVQQIQAVISS